MTISDNKITKVVSTRELGPMTGNKKFYDENMSIEEIKKDLLERRKMLGKYKGFDGKKIIVPYQNLNKHDRGHAVDATEEIKDLLNDDENYDLWNLDIPCDVMLIKSDLKGVVVGYPVADCPVLIGKTKDTLSLVHCGAKEINDNLPSMFVDKIREMTDEKEENIKIFVGPCASSQNYIYETYPNWAKEEFWNKFIKKEDDGYHIDLKGALISQLIKKGIRNLKMSTEDTITSQQYYSNYAEYHGNKEAAGRFLVGAFYEPKQKVKKISK